MGEKNLNPCRWLDCPIENDNFREFVFTIILVFDLSYIAHFHA